MATRRLLIFLAGALAIGMGAAWMVVDFCPVSPNDQVCQVDVPYAVGVQNDEATFDLNFEPGTTYRIIVASVTSQEVESTITPSAEAIPSVERFPLLPVPRLQSAKPKVFRPRTQTTPFVPQGVPYVFSKPSQNRAFYLHVTDGPLDDARQYAKVVVHPVAEGRFVRVFLDSQMVASQLAKGLVEEIVRLFDEQIVPGSRKVLGQFRDVDGDGKFAIVISPWLGKLQGGQTALGGFVRGSDFQNSVRTPFGNRADVMYLNSNLQPGPHLKTLLAHEYAHAICFSERLPTTSQPDGLPTEEDWLNEAIAHLAENIHDTGWTNLDYRVSRFLDEMDRSPLVVRNYYANGLWRDPGCRGATYLFLRWVTDQFGEEVLTRLTRHSEPGIKNLEAATGVPFPDLFRAWTIALAQEGSQPNAAFRTIALTDRLGRWSLQGPRALEWQVDHKEESFSLLGTTAKMIDVRTQTPGVYRLRVRSSGKPQLQVTVIRQVESLESPQVSTDWQYPVSLPVLASPMLHVRIPAGRKILRISLECQAASAQSHCWEADQLPAMQVPSDSEETRKYVLNPPERLFPLGEGSANRWQLKILTVDESGRRSAQWIDLPHPLGDATQDDKPLASRPGTSVL